MPLWTGTRKQKFPLGRDGETGKFTVFYPGQGASMSIEFTKELEGMEHAGRVTLLCEGATGTPDAAFNCSPLSAPL
jgi:hypothetical protein